MTNIPNPYYNHTVLNLPIDLDVVDSNEIAVLSLSGYWTLKIINIGRFIDDFHFGEFIKIEYD
jgi:hypothetical protein